MLDRPEFDYLGFAIYSNIFGFNATVGNNGAQSRLVIYLRCNGVH